MKRIKKRIRIRNYQAKQMGKYYAKAVEEFGGIEYATVEFKNKVFRRALQPKKENKQRKQTIIKSVTYSILTSIFTSIFTSIIASYIYQRLCM